MKLAADSWDRNRITPWQLLNGRWYKREDHFAPLGVRSINGAKLRQLDYLIGNAYAAGYRGIVTGASILSPQLSMTAIVAARYGMPCTIMVGGTQPQTMVEKPNVEIALAAGADFEIGAVGYNPALQQRVKAAATETGAYRVAYGITTHEDASDEDLLNFHNVGAAQVAGVIPSGVRHLVIPFGSGNTATSILLGLSRLANKPRVTLVQIGPSKLSWMQSRLERMGVHPGDYAAMDVNVHVLHDVYYNYSDRQRMTLDGIVFHPTYEGKVVYQMMQHPERYPGWHKGDGSTALWIVGSEPQPAATRQALHTSRYGSITRAA